MAKGRPPSLDVRWYTGQDVGQVVNPGETLFGYLEEWLRHGHNLSPLAVPFGLEVHRVRDDRFDQLPGFLSDCLPDQWGTRLLMDDFAAEGVTPTPIKKLAWVGKRAIGALSFHPSSGPAGDSSAWAQVQPILLTREAQAVLRKDPPEAFATLRRGGTAGGAFPKATVALLPDGAMLCGGDVAAVARQHPGARLGILKLDCEDTAGRPSTDGRLEFAYMEMARAARLRTARCEVLSAADQERQRYHLFVERFDVADGGARRVHLVTLAGLLESHDLTYNHLLDATRRVTADHAEVCEAVRRMIFNVRAANADDHGKNHSFAFDDSIQRWRLSPAYDITLNYSANRLFNGLYPATFGSSPRRSRLVEVAVDFGVTEAEFEEIDAEVTDSVAQWERFASLADLTLADTQRAAAAQRTVALALAAEGPPVKRRKRKLRWM